MQLHPNNNHQRTFTSPVSKYSNNQFQAPPNNMAMQAQYQPPQNVYSMNPNHNLQMNPQNISRMPQTSPNNNILNNNSILAKSYLQESQVQQQGQPKSHVLRNIQNVTNSRLMNKSSNNQSRSLAHISQSQLIAEKLPVFQDDIYRDDIFGLVMSNVHSSSSLQHSVPRQAQLYEKRWKYTPYSGYDPQNWKPDSIFKNKDECKQIKMQRGKGLVKGDTLTDIDRHDFTAQWKGNPGPGQYERPLLKDRLTRKLQMIKWKREQERKAQLGQINQNLGY